MRTLSLLSGATLAIALSACADIVNFPNIPGVTGDGSAAEDGGTDAPSDATFGDANNADATSDAHTDSTVPDANGDSASKDANPDSEIDATHDAPSDSPANNSADGGDASSCANLCTLGQTACGDAGAIACEVADGSSCTTWVETTPCGPHQTCGLPSDGGAAVCTCNSTSCTGNGTTCEPGSTNVIDTCATDSNGCVYVADSGACTPSGYVCSGAAPNAVCSATCTSTCSSGQSECSTGQIAGCYDAGGGCLLWGEPASCPDSKQTCTGSPGTASCTCNAPAEACTAVGTYCENGSTEVTCSQDTYSCWTATTSACTCCGSGCVDEQTDRSNCGSCGHQCGGVAACTSGVCVSPTYTVTGAVQTFVVPTGITEITVTAIGAYGGGDAGEGAEVVATIPVTAGATLYLYVGGSPTDGGVVSSYNGGGVSSAAYAFAGGGGASDVRIGGTALANRVLVAAGGGGAGYVNGVTIATEGGGAGGDPTGQSTGTLSCFAKTLTGTTLTWKSMGGGGATTAGAGVGADGGVNGALGSGGAGPVLVFSDGGSAIAGGGGGGYYGGGSGENSDYTPVPNIYYCSSGGGGGSSYAESSATNMSMTVTANPSSGSIVLRF